MNLLTIKIEKLGKGKNSGYCATIKELKNSTIMADTLPEIFDLIPDMIDTCKKYHIGKTTKQKSAHHKKSLAKI